MSGPKGMSGNNQARPGSQASQAAKPARLPPEYSVRIPLIVLEGGVRAQLFSQNLVLGQLRLITENHFIPKGMSGNLVKRFRMQSEFYF